MITWNARSIKNKLTFIQSFTFTKSINILCLTETWLLPTIHNNEIVPSNYEIYRRDRHSTGGGVLIAISNDLPSRLVYTADDIELIVVEILLPNPVTLICVYIPPNSPQSTATSFVQHIHKFTRSKNTLIITGDLNHPEIDWTSLSGNSFAGDVICDCFFKLNLVQLINEPTHIGGNTLDIIASTHPQLVFNISITPPPDSIKSDHYILNATLRTHTVPQVTTRKTVWLYQNVNLAKLQEYQQTANLVLPHDNTNAAWYHLSNFILQLRSKFVPAITTSCSSPKWFNSKIKHNLNCVHTLRRLAKKKPSTTKLIKLKEAEDKLQQLMYSTKQEYELSLISAGNTKKLYSYLRHLSSNATIPSCIFDPKSTTPILTPKDTAEAFNAFFHSTFTISDYKLPPTDQLPTPTKQLHTITIDVDDVSTAIASLDPSKAYGCDDISPRMIQLCSKLLLIPLTNLYQQCIDTASIPSQWKIQKIIPIHKKGDRSIISNYRPISLLCTLSTMLESIIYRKIIDFIRPLLSPHQYGFLTNRSCLMNLLISYSNVLESFNRAHITDAIYLDFAKAFDTLPHAKLLYKLWQFGITGQLWLWFKNYLEERCQFVQINNTHSSLLPVLSGVPQGSVLGPLLFLVYINDLATTVSHSSISLFADDTKLMLDIIRSSETNLQLDLHAVSEWCTQWELNLNLDKCKFLRFTAKQSDNNTTRYSLNNQIISMEQEICDLGIHISNPLSFQSHYKFICSKAYQSLYMIRRSLQLQTAPILIKKQLYLTLVRSKLTYCSQLWRPYQIKDIITLENVQRRATKFITNDYISDYKSRLMQLHLLPLMYQYELQDLLFLIKCLQNQPDNINIHDHVNFVTTSTRRNNQMLRYNYARTSITRHSFFNRVVRLWNALQPINIEQPFASIKYQITEIFWTKFLQNFESNNACTYHYICPCPQCRLIPP